MWDATCDDRKKSLAELFVFGTPGFQRRFPLVLSIFVMVGFDAFGNFVTITKDRERLWQRG